MTRSSGVGSVPPRAGLLLGLTALLAVSFAIRFYRLGDTDTRSDEVELVSQLQAGIGPIEYFKWFVEVFQSGRQMPLSRVATCVYVRAFGLKPTLFNVRTPFAALSALIPLFLFFFGRWWVGPRLGWILGVLGLINPYALFWGRIGLAYGFLLPLMTMTVALFVPLLRRAAVGQPPETSGLVGFVAASILGCYSHLSAWPLTSLLWLAVVVLYLRQGGWHPRVVPLRVWIGLAAWASTVAPWAISFLSASKDAWDLAGVVSEADPVYRFAAMRRLPFVLGWGGGIRGSLLTFGLPVVGLLLAWRNPALRPGVQLMLAIGGLLLLMLATMMRLSGGIYTLRYFTPMWLLPLLLGGLALHELSTWSRRRWSHPAATGLTTAILLTGMAAHAAAPLWWIVNLPGHPTPYRLINRWMDEHLPKGTPVVVDRWYEPAHEMRFHAPTNVIVTFTVPNEPLNNFLGLRWRETVMRFAERYPDAAYLELIKSYFYVPGVGPWDWPRRYFARHVAITNQPALRLRERLLGTTEDFYADNTNRIICEIFYNTTEDMIKKTRAAGRPFFLTYGEGWGYTKTRDFRDWRVLEDGATLEIHNLTDTPRNAQLVMRGVAVNGTKRVRSSAGGQEIFLANQLHEWRIPLEELPPGRTLVQLSDPLWSAARVPLLVDDLHVDAQGS